MRTGRKTWVALAVALVVACTPGPEQPADPVWGKEACAHCRMLVSERPPAAQLTLPDGTRLHFDDVGCMAAWLEEHRAAPVGAWAHHGEGWTPVAEARFASGVPTPMDFGFVAAEEGVSWTEVQAAVRGKTRHLGDVP